MTRTRPNVLLITSDQHRADCFGFAGRRVYTPHLDAMAARGARFDACITPNLVCQPSRASILSGLLPRTHGVCDNGIDLDPALGERGLAGSLGAAGYATGLIGKAHFSTNLTFAPTGTPECQHSQARYPANWFGPYMGFEHVELVVEGHNNWLPLPPPNGQHHSRWYFADGEGEARNVQYLANVGPERIAPQTHFSALPAAWHNSTWIGDRTVEFIRAHREQPFFAWMSLPDPHHPFDCPLPWSRLHHDDEVELPVHRTRDFERRPWWHRASVESEPAGTPEQKKTRKNVSRMGELDEAQLRRVTANYYGMISLIDHQVGRVQTALAALGLLDNTLVIFTTDHGEFLGDHGLMLKGPMAYESLLRVALLMRGPGMPAGWRSDAPVSTLDLPATILDLCGASALAPTHGRSLKPVLAGGTRDFALSEWDLGAQRCGVELQLRTVRTRDAKLTLEMSSGTGELYDLVDDPLEMNNRFDDPSWRARRGELEDMIRSRPDDAVPRRAASGLA